MPFLSLLGLGDSNVTDAVVQKAYKTALRKNPSNVEALRHAAAVLKGGAFSSVPAASPALPALSLSLHTFKIETECATARASCPAYGSASAQGRRSTMEDAVLCAAPIDNAHIFAVFDGHGGSRAAKLLARQLPSALQKEHAERGGGDEAMILGEDAARSAFTALENRIQAQGWDDGSCACVALLDVCTRRLQLLQLGDCNALLCSRQDGAPPAVLCTAHRPSEPTEAVRLSAMGAPVSATGRLAGLAVSRAFGDRDIKEALPYDVLLVEPEVVMQPLKPEDALLILACDGLWDYLDADAATAVVRAALPSLGADDGVGPSPSDLAAVAHALAEAALNRGSDDNVSVVVVDVSLPSGQRHSQAHAGYSCSNSGGAATEIT